jgi:hypothetical protein
MYMMKCCEEENFSHGNLIPYGNIEMSPSAGILNYGQVVHQQLIIYPNTTPLVYICTYKKHPNIHAYGYDDDVFRGCLKV